MNISPRTTARLVSNAFEATGTKPPKAVAAAFADAEKLEQAASVVGSTNITLTEAVAASVLADRDPATDPAVLQVITNSALAQANLATSLPAAGYDALSVTCYEHIDAIVSAWRKPFEAAARDLAEAHGHIGELDLDDTTAILALGSNIADVWAKAQNADRLIDNVLGGWSSLMMLCRVQTNPSHRVLRLADVDYQTFRSLPEKLKPWQALQAGLTLSLPTASEYRARVRAITEAADAPETVVNVMRSAIAGREIHEQVA